jgi:hypothetical protein
MRSRNGEFFQIGCGPNFQGGLITLCTCKHRMRTFKNPKQWKGLWIAGFTGRSAGEDANYLVYLMQVEHAFGSHRDLWFSRQIPAAAKRAKATHRDRFGDIYEPRARDIDEWDKHEYIPPCPDHCHAGHWTNDVGYRGVGGRHAALLVGDPRKSFLWNRPVIRYTGQLGRGQSKCKLSKLLDRLQAGEPL